MAGLGIGDSWCFRTISYRSAVSLRVHSCDAESAFCTTLRKTLALGYDCEAISLEILRIFPLVTLAVSVKHTLSCDLPS